MAMDGISWEVVTLSFGIPNLNRIAYGDDKFLVLATGSTNVLSSPNGAEWTVEDTALPASVNYNAFTYGGGKFIALGANSYDSYYSEGVYVATSHLFDLLGNPLNQIGDFSRIETGSYVGTGTYGLNNANSLTFSFVPKLVFIGAFSSNTWLAAFLNPQESASYSKDGIRTHLNNADYNSNFYHRFSGNSMSWYSNYDSAGVSQYNASGTTYYWIAIG